MCLIMAHRTRRPFGRALNGLVVSIGLLMPQVAATPLMASPPAQSDEDMRAFNKTLDRAFGKDFLNILREKFPEEYRSLIARAMVGIVKSTLMSEKDYDSARIEGAKVGAELLAKHKDYILTAPPGAARSYLKAYSKFLRTMTSTPSLCSKFLGQGYASLTVAETKRLDMQQMQKASVQMLNGIALGRDLPVEARPATQDDRTAVFAEWVTRPRVDKGWFALISKNQWENPDYCKAFASLVDSMSVSRLPEAEPVARELMYILAGGTPG